VREGKEGCKESAEGERAGESERGWERGGSGLTKGVTGQVRSWQNPHVIFPQVEQSFNLLNNLPHALVPVFFSSGRHLFQDPS